MEIHSGCAAAQARERKVAAAAAERTTLQKRCARLSTELLFVVKPDRDPFLPFSTSFKAASASFSFQQSALTSTPVRCTQRVTTPRRLLLLPRTRSSFSAAPPL